MADLFGGGAVGAVMGEMAKYALQTIKSGLEFNSTLERNIETLNSVVPLVEEMKRYNKVLDRPIQEIEKLEKHITEGQELVNKSEKKKRSLFGFRSFADLKTKLDKKDGGLRRYMSINVQAENKRDLMEVLSSVKQVLEILKSGESLGKNQIRGLKGAPEEPDCVMGMDESFNKLRNELLLKDGVSVNVLTGLGGSGKSSLAKKLCWDPQIKGKFGLNIFFVTVSKTPNLQNIIRTLFEYCGCKVPDFQNDEDATNRLGVLLRCVGRFPILLVLDDVWSVSLVEKFKFQMSDYKILVTSRVAYPRFTSFPLDALGHEHAVSLFRDIAQLNCVPDENSYVPDGNLVDEIVRSCKGSPLALKVIAGSLCKQPFEEWQNLKERLQRQSILEIHQKKSIEEESSSTDLLSRLQQSLELLEVKLSISEKECFMDLGLFVEDQRIPVAALIDMWAELYNLDKDGKDGSNAMTIVHDLNSKNLINVIVTRKVAEETDMYYNNHYVMLHDLLRELAIHQSKVEDFEQKKRLIIDLNGDNRPDWWWVGQNQQGIIGYISSFIHRILVKQEQQKVAARILSISTDAMPNLEELSIDYCNDLVKLPEGISNITPLKKLCITNCHKLKALPEDTAKLENLELLRLCSCSDLEKMPEVVGGLNELKCLDISDCVSLSELPEDIGDLQKIKKLYMKGCSSLSTLPDSVFNFAKLKHAVHVICDDERAALWEEFSSIPNLKIEMPKVDVNLNWLPGVRS